MGVLAMGLGGRDRDRAIAIAGTVTIDEPMIHVLAVATFVVFGLFPAYFLIYLASRARRAHNRSFTGKWLLWWALARVALVVAVVILALACGAGWIAGAAVARPLLQALVLTLIVSGVLGIAGGCVINLVRAISGPARET